MEGLKPPAVIEIGDFDKGLSYIKQISEELTSQLRYSPHYFFMLPVKRQGGWSPSGFPYTLPGVDVLEGGKFTSNNGAGSSHDPLQSFAVASGADSKPGGDAAGQDALHSAGVE